MPKVDQTQGVNCAPKDRTPPPTPRIQQAIAFDKAKDGASVGNRGGNAGNSSGTRDPVYIELANIEVGTSIELINLSANPDGSFDCKEKISLELTGRDVKNRQGAIYLNTKQMNELGLKPGDMFSLRALDHNGNASDAVTGELEPNSWANQQVIEDGRWTNERGAQINALDGEGERKAIIAKAVNDGRPPLVLEDNVSISTKGNGQKDMVFDRALEPRATVEIQNSRTGATFTGAVDDDGKLTVPLKGIEDGDPLLIQVTDNNGVRGKDMEIVYSGKCKDGKAPKMKGGLGARLPGVI